MIGWQEYYGAEGHLSESTLTGPGQVVDRDLAEALHTTRLAMVEAGIGTRFLAVRGVRVLSDDEARASRRHWFVHGDPWTVLIGWTQRDVRVGSVNLLEGGMAGPPELQCPTLYAPLPVEGLELGELAELVQRAHRATRRRIRLCPLCHSPRYGGGCTCDAEATGTIYD